jgi:hypothetical protein
MRDIARFFETQITQYELQRRAEEASRKIVAQRVIHLPGPQEEAANDEPR